MVEDFPLRTINAVCLFVGSLITVDLMDDFSVVVTRWSDGCVVRFLFDSLLGVRLIVFRQLERIVNPCGALWRAKSTHSSGSLSRKSITLTIGKCAMSRQMLKCCKWLCGSNNCVELSVSDEYSTECKPRVEQSMVSVAWLQLHWGMMYTFPPTQTKKVSTVVNTNILFVCFVSSVKSLKTFNITFPKKLLTARE